jgi:hypothetical protein
LVNSAALASTTGAELGLGIARSIVAVASKLLS